MRQQNYNSDLETVINKIKRNRIDLQPNFQRGLVWTEAKKRRLIDTVLRGWAIPPIHFVRNADETLSVLDGQQRLAALLAFYNDEFRVEAFDPVDELVAVNSGKFFSDLDETVKERFLSFKLPCYDIEDYEPEEPYELFFRLNLPTGLTSAEKRNALFGDAREQVANLVSNQKLWNKDTLGFSNNRMAYEDVVARACVLVENRSLRSSLRAKEIDQYYRSKSGFSPETVEIVEDAIQRLSSSLRTSRSQNKFNKATLQSWIVFTARANLKQLKIDLGGILSQFESKERGLSKIPASRKNQALFQVYKDRSSLRVTDTLSVIARDFTMWQLSAEAGLAQTTSRMNDLLLSTEHFDRLVVENPNASEEDLVTNYIDETKEWGELK